jgi:predicted membrane protein
MSERAKLTIGNVVALIILICSAVARFNQSVIIGNVLMFIVIGIFVYFVQIRTYLELDEFTEEKKRLVIVKDELAELKGEKIKSVDIDSQEFYDEYE